MIRELIKKAECYVDIRIIFFFFGAALLIPIALTTNYLNSGVLVNDVPIPYWASFITAAISLAFTSYMIFSFLTEEKSRLSIVGLLICFVLIVNNIVTTFLQPETIISHIYSFRLVYYVDIVTKIELISKFVYSVLFLNIILYIYIFIFYLPKLIKDNNVLKFIIDLFLVFTMVAIVYSLIFESDKYTVFISNIFNFEGNNTVFSVNSLTSFFSHKNVFGLFLMVSVIACIINFTFTRNIVYPVLSVIIGLYLLLTYSKSSILLAWLFLISFFYFYNITTIKHNLTFKITLLSVMSFLLLITLVAILVLYLNNSKASEVFNAIFKDFGTFQTRNLLWQNVMEIITPSWLVTGRGFGVVETIIPEASYVSIVERLPHEHSWFYSLLAKGGLFLVLAFIIFLVYLSYLFYQSFHINKVMSITLILGATTCFAQSFIENNYYVLFIFALFFEVLIIRRGVKDEE